MFERFTDEARRVVVLAQEEARALGHGYIGTEHILLGLLSEGEGLAARALGALEITLDAAREQITEMIGEGTGQPSGHIPFTPRTKKVLELSLREAQRLGDSYIGTEHILLGVAREGEGVGAQVLDRLGASTDRLLAQVLTTARTAPGEELRRVSVGRMPVTQPANVRAMMSRLDDIAERLTRIEALLAGMQGAPPRRSRKPAAGQAGPRKAEPRGQAEPPGQAGSSAEPGQPEPPAAQA
jgi:ATP-dependent Clp protease ATP-binding subunit ClpC